jgi:hypothetical protein
MAATAESMIASLAGPAEGSEGGTAADSGAGGEHSTAQPAGADAGIANDPAAPGSGGPGGDVRAPVNDPAAAAQQPAVKDTPESIERKHLAALHQERGEKKALREQLAQMQAQLEALKSTAPKPEQPAQEPEPDFLADPKGYVDSKVQAALAKLDKAEKTTQETADQVKQREANEAVLRATQAAEAQFYSSTPDYPEALQHIRSVRTQQLQIQHPEATPEQINNHIAYEERETARMLVSQNRNPAEFAYQFAKTLGYATKAAAKPAAPAVDKDAVRTLGSGGGNGTPSEDAGNSMPEFAAARAEVQARFKKKR